MFGTRLHLMIVVLLAAASAQAAEIRFRAVAEPSSALVKLGDVAEVVDLDSRAAAQLRAVELFPAPVPGESRFVASGEIEQLLDRRGISIRLHRFSGATQIRVSREQTVAPNVRPEAPLRALSKAVVKRSEDHVQRAIAEYLSRHVSEDEAWNIEAPLTEEEARAVDNAKSVSVLRGRWEARPGDVETWLGEQQFLFGLSAEDASQNFVVRARVSLPPLVVVAARSIPRGEVIRSGDVRTERTSQSGLVEFSDVSQAIGLEAVRNISAGQPISGDYVRPPVLVQRGEVVTVYVRSAGVKVRTLARSQKEGSRGELIEVQGLTDRRRFFAVVSGPAEVEVYAHSASAARPQRRNVR